MNLAIQKVVPVVRSARILQVEGLFDLPPAEHSESNWTIELPLEGLSWQLGLIVGPSGSGKTTLAQAAFPHALFLSAHLGYDWPGDRAVVDGFPNGLSIKEIVAALAQIGFSSPPAWRRPFRCLSTGEQFRSTVARALLDPAPLVVLDEFTSVVDRTVAKIGSAAVARAVRQRSGKQFVCVTCHADIEDWLTPDWALTMPAGAFTRRPLRRRPAIRLEIRRVHHSAWGLFHHYHYLNRALSKQARCFLASWEGRPVAFASALHAAGRMCYWREHRTVCLPDFQGAGIGNALSEFVAGVMKATGKPYYSTTGHPAMWHHRSASPLWRIVRGPSRTDGNRNERRSGAVRYGATRASNRLTAGFEYVGPVLWEEARKMILV